MKTPPLLIPGDTVAVVAPSGIVDKERIKSAIETLESWNLRVVEGANLFKREGIFAGDDSERLSDLQNALDNPEIKGVFCARGGYGLSRIIDRVDFNRFIAFPKWIVGYSDITLLHLYVNHITGIPVIHGEMPHNYGNHDISTDSLMSLREILFTGSCAFQWDSDIVNEGEATGMLSGGNLSLITNLLGTGVKDYFNDKILFIEETGEEQYRIDRMLMGLRLAGVFSKIRGLVVGGVSDLPDSVVPFGKSIQEMVLEAVSESGVPVTFNFPAGHINDNRAFYLGKEYLLRVDSISSVLACPDR